LLTLEYLDQGGGPLTNQRFTGKMEQLAKEQQISVLKDARSKGSYKVGKWKSYMLGQREVIRQGSGSLTFSVKVVSLNSPQGE
jgi:hypothetical protein